MSTAAFPCRQCQTLLSSDAAEPGAMMLCAVCRTPHWPVRKATNTLGDDKPIAQARTALIFGVASILFCPAAIPAIVMGWLALRKIRNSGDRLAGKGAAQGAIGLGLAFGFFAPLAMSSFVLPFAKMAQIIEATALPDRVAVINARFRAGPLPPWLLPMHGQEAPIQNVRLVVYADSAPPPPSRVVFVATEVPTFLGQTIADRSFASWQAIQLMDFTPHSSQSVDWRMGKKSLAVNVETGAEATSKWAMRRYTAAVPRGQRQLVLMAVTADPDPASPASRSLTEEEVKGIFLSYAFPEPRK